MKKPIKPKAIKAWAAVSENGDILSIGRTGNEAKLKVPMMIPYREKTIRVLITPL